MTTADTASQTTGADAKANVAQLIYAIVPAGHEPQGQGIGRSPAPLRTVTHGEIAALVSAVAVDEPLDRAEDLENYSRIVDNLVRETSIVPIRFGAALEDEAAVASGLLEPNAEQFGAALRDLGGQAEYLVSGQYVEQTVLREILQENQQAAELAETLRTTPAAAGRDVSLALGEIINSELEHKREGDTDIMVNTLRQLTEELVLRPPTHEEEIATLAVLVPLDKEDELVHVVDLLSKQWENRVSLRIVGPLAAWDFLTIEATESQ
ncbi:gas vesicle protein GvpFL [Nocardia yunnanensis]|uniref:Gas vesicle protein GvpFL n=1 Tax=Nocardia yunnanensis TaxID=2382165 RepID=A0A386ZEL7_9NOCA|nr:GvpL/GvpF family gas vesicle protein [Nocardia yunnanensis]AYF75837.1 gas vesicle protein GvpFL [Nocardia yunnanensis]